MDFDLCVECSSKGVCLEALYHLVSLSVVIFSLKSSQALNILFLDPKLSDLRRRKKYGRI